VRMSTDLEGDEATKTCNKFGGDRNFYAVDFVDDEATLELLSIDGQVDADSRGEAARVW
jgi:hypothetical protein